MDGKPTRGGRRQNAGRKSGPQGKRIKTVITMRPDQYGSIKGNLSATIEQALDEWLKKRTSFPEHMHPDISTEKTPTVGHLKLKI